MDIGSPGNPLRVLNLQTHFPIQIYTKENTTNNKKVTTSLLVKKRENELMLFHIQIIQAIVTTYLVQTFCVFYVAEQLYPNHHDNNIHK